MRLALKIFLAYSLVIVVLVGVAVWTLGEVAQLISADRRITVRAVDSLRLEAFLRERVEQAHKFEMRYLVFGDREYETVPTQEAVKIQNGLRQLNELLGTDAERERLERAVRAYAEYRAAVVRGRDLRARGDGGGAARMLEVQAQPALDRVVGALDGLLVLTKAALSESQVQAVTALGEVQTEVGRLKARTWTAVVVALVTAIAAALAGTAAIAWRMTRSLRRLAAATALLAEGSFQPVPVETADEIGILARSFNSMAARLRELDALKEQFYATMSHELRSPLTSAREAARLLEAGGAGPLTPKQEKLVAIIHRSAERLLGLVNQVLDLSRLTAGLLPIDRRPVDLERVVLRAVKELRIQAEERGVGLMTEHGPGPFEMLGDEDRLVQVVVNLVANGIRFTPAGGSVTVRLAEAGGALELRVEDTGAGIPADALPYIFDRYRQAHTGHGGTGLGLAIARGLVEAHGGRVTVESEEGKGSRFTVVFPREAVALPRADDAEAR